MCFSEIFQNNTEKTRYAYSTLYLRKHTNQLFYLGIRVAILVKRRRPFEKLFVFEKKNDVVFIGK